MTTEVTQNSPDGQFEIHLDGHRVGFAAYRDADRNGVLVRSFIHTEIDDGHEGQGLGGRLIRTALDASRDDGFVVLPHCPFVRGYIDSHPEYLDLVPRDRRAQFGLAPA